MLTYCGVVREVAGICLNSGELTHDGCVWSGGGPIDIRAGFIYATGDACTRNNRIFTPYVFTLERERERERESTYTCKSILRTSEALLMLPLPAVHLYFTNATCCAISITLRLCLPVSS